MAFQFKLDPSSLPKLDAAGVNYPEWRAAWTIAFKYAELYDHISADDSVSSSKRATREDTKQYDAAENKAMVMLISSVATELVGQITSCDSAAKAWARLGEQFDRDTSNLTIYQFRSLVSLKYSDGDDLKAHINNFHNSWVQLSKKCRTSSQSVARALTAVLDSDDVKGAFYLSTLPDTMDHVIDGLSTRDLTKFSDVEPRILDIAEKYSLGATENTAYSAYGNRRPLPRSTTSRSSTPSSQQAKICTWCRKNGFKHDGHLYNECARLKQFKQEKDKILHGHKEEEIKAIASTARFGDNGSDSGDEGTKEVVAF